jgi:hypothetical protein
MDTQNVIVARRHGLQEVLLRGYSLLQEPFVNETVFLRRKNMRTQIQVVAFVVNELERQHAVSLSLRILKRNPRRNKIVLT